jgi:hypothetical protein
MVGDSVNRAANDSIQFAKFSGDVYRDGIVHEHGSYRVFKVDPVTFPGFVPVQLNTDRDAIHLGQNLTVVSYGPANSLSDSSGDNLTWPGRALEGSLEVTLIDDPNDWFWAGNTGVGVCVGTYYLWADLTLGCRIGFASRDLYISRVAVSTCRGLGSPCTRQQQETCCSCQ